ncbi:MAG TPA: isoprenylcysteine carboxylmethyltransferase family protein [Thermoanaerobaculia bacterium]|nr:isoprenylcysteine carboxylmethyltransferase family protein [Thermoanaerobaculia bacterium]
MILALKNLLFVVLVPGTVAVYVPLLLVRGEQPTANLAARLLACLLIGVGAAALLWCVWNFARLGRGTPAPIDAPKRLVVAGPHRWVRNPMYLAVLGVIAGWALLFESRGVLVYLASMAVLFHLVVVFYEEPALRSQFGPEYERYCESVGRWRPRRPRGPE